jgi:hypothetical protein
MKQLEIVLTRLENLRQKKRLSDHMKVQELNVLFVILRQAELKPGEPLFIIRGQDAAGPAGVHDYAQQAQHVGASVDFTQAVSQRELDFRDWQRMNPHYVKVPD